MPPRGPKGTSLLSKICLASKLLLFSLYYSVLYKEAKYLCPERGEKFRDMDQCYTPTRKIKYKQKEDGKEAKQKIHILLLEVNLVALKMTYNLLRAH